MSTRKDLLGINEKMVKACHSDGIIVNAPSGGRGRLERYVCPERKVITLNFYEKLSGNYVATRVEAGEVLKEPK